MLHNNLALYIHWPYCLSKCPYCDFNSHVSQNIDYEAWEKAYIRELDYFHTLTMDRHIVSIYFGGGTPSLMPPALVDSVLNHIQKKWSIDPNLEITLEANPTSIEAQKFQELTHAGVNRVSIGSLGVIGPSRINYARIIPMVDYTAKIVGKILG